VAGTDQGAVYVFNGAAGGLTATGVKFLTQDTAGVADASENADEFGSLLASGDFNGDLFDDLYIAAGGETLGAANLAGVLHLLPGSASGVTATGSALFQQGANGTPDTAEASDFFGGT
jgi:hypothetical protein